MTAQARYKIAYPIIAAMALIGFASRYHTYPEWGANLHLKIFAISFLLISLIFEFHLWLNKYLDKRMPFESGEVKRISLQLLLSLPFMLLVKISIYDNLFIHIPVYMDKLTNMFVSIIYIFLGLFLNSVFFAQHYFKKWKEQIQFAERLEKEKAQVQFDNLKNQLNPHFLFNALTSLNSLIFENQELASKFLHQLSKVYRYVLQNERPLVGLKAEMDFAKNYIFLLKTRFQEAFEVEIDLKEEDLEKFIAPVTLQILIENAVKHNEASLEKPLVVNISTNGQSLFVKNRLQKKGSIEHSNKQGLNRLMSLYSFLSKEKVEVFENGNLFIVKIPLVT